jgi:hypothetical protein
VLKDPTPPKPVPKVDHAATALSAFSLPPRLGSYVPQMSAPSDKSKKPVCPAPSPVTVASPPPPPHPKDPTPVALKPVPAAPLPVLKDPTPLAEIPILPPQDPTPPKPAPKVDHAANALSDFGFDQITILEPDKWTKSDCPVPRGEDDSWYCSLPAIEPPPEQPKPVLRKYLPVRPALEPPPATSAITELVDASVLVDRVRPKPAVAKRLPAPARPLTIPLVLGIFAAMAGVALPAAAALSNNRFGVLGFCISGLLLPLAPLAWMAGLAVEQRRREQGLRVERRVVVGRLLGQWGTLLLAAEGTLALLLIAAVRLAAR